MSNRKVYTARNGKQQYMPSVNLLQECHDECGGFCLACGEVSYGVEPDALKYHCECCGEHKVYGPDSLVMMGLMYVESENV